MDVGIRPIKQGPVGSTDQFAPGSGRWLVRCTKQAIAHERADTQALKGTRQSPWPIIGGTGEGPFVVQHVLPFSTRAGAVLLVMMMMMMMRLKP